MVRVVEEEEEGVVVIAAEGAHVLSTDIAERERRWCFDS